MFSSSGSFKPVGGDCKPLANRRPKKQSKKPAQVLFPNADPVKWENPLEVPYNDGEVLKEVVDAMGECHKKVYSLMITINASDQNMAKYTPKEMSQDMRDTFKRMRCKLSVILVGEYSKKMRWHYHGLINVENVDILDRVKRTVVRRYGNTLTELIKDQVAVVDYMFKQYTKKDLTVFYPWNDSKCFVQVNK